MIKISYAITVKDELDEVKRLISFLLEHKRSEDEIVVLWDENGSEEIFNYFTSVEIRYKISAFSVGNFNNDFAAWKNRLNKLCNGTHIFQIDADEIPNKNLILSLPELLESNPEVDLFYIPRINTVEGITLEHIRKWGWRKEGNGWINFPDLQGRIYKNSPEIKWEGKVHERIIGTKKHTILPPQEEYCLYHPKTIERQEKQNNFYNQI